MNKKIKRKFHWSKKLLIAVAVFLILASITVWYIYTVTFTDTSKTEADHHINAIELIHQFEENDSLANIKYAEKIITVNGIISELEMADTSLNLKMSDIGSGSYILFAFQRDNLDEARKLKVGDSVSIKGSCSGGAYSDILEAEFINFKRSVINRN